MHVIMSIAIRDVSLESASAVPTCNDSHSVEDDFGIRRATQLYVYPARTERSTRKRYDILPLFTMVKQMEKHILANITPQNTHSLLGSTCIPLTHEKPSLPKQARAANTVPRCNSHQTQHSFQCEKQKCSVIALHDRASFQDDA